MKIETSYTDGPLHLLELSVATCLEAGIAEYLYKNNGADNPFSMIRVSVKADHIRIVCICSDPKYEDDFRKIVSDCYICNIVSLNKVISFKVG